MPRTRTYGLDIDTIRYAQRVKSGSGATILPEPLKQINKFVVGVKKLGLWNSMVCWPMRGIHNAGTGSTVYSLGGQGAFNGTMVNGPVWSSSGIDTTTANYITTTNPFADTKIFVHVHTLTNSSDVDGASLASYASEPETGYEILYYQNTPDVRFYSGTFVSNSRITTVNCNDSKPHFVAGITDDISSMIFVDGIGGSFTALTSPRLTATSNLTVGRRNAANSVSVPCRSSFVCIFTKYTNEISFIYSLYKRTLGIGLNLP